MSKTVSIPRILISAPASGSGKTLFTCGLMQAFLNYGLQIHGCKCGPDYIDPMFHRQVLGIPSRNLDSFFSDTEGLFHTLLAGHQSDLTIIEGVMGYYDGLGGFQTNGSSYDIAVKTQTPSILLLPCKGMSLSAVAILVGLLHYKDNNMIAGVVFNRISPTIYHSLKTVIENDPNISIKVLGYLPDRKDISLKSRHLGLITPNEITDLKEQLMLLAEQIQETVDLEGILSIAHMAMPISVSDICSFKENKLYSTCSSAPNIAIASDEAFCFYYEETLELLRLLGANLLFFSPCRSNHLPENTNALYLGGGYPELYADTLSNNINLRAEIHKKLSNGLPCIAECGGFMYLHDSIQNKKGVSYPMCGIISGECFPKKKLRHFGYITMTAQRDTAFLLKGTNIHGHEFHYWESTNHGNAFLAKKPTGNRFWECIHSTDTLLAGYPHFSFSSNPELLKNFVLAATKYKEKNT